ncbi:uncharacterized protein FIBRA_08595 [Fibroporia radiculosa]|uniref:PCI domain-containing protein n=1 Tax=Fibroporia radiculosa TaxID=599839 RepID=J4ICF9_9APHY|nr:uncharacterized protein FIBRA_08595 [Fibroporia radiculosa]CCM06341.1 predicted protein [Fibroporia radiculosa]
MELGFNHAAKLEPFLLMSKAAKGAAAAKLVQDATSAPGVFVFAELLELPNVQELANSENSSYFSLLQLFAYKTFPDYLQHRDALPALNDAQTIKLKHLTLVSLAMESRILPYSQLLDTLQMPGIRELEDLIIDAIYLDVIRGKLDQKEQQFDVEFTMGRDLEPGKIEQLLASLQNWASTSSAVLSTLDDKLATLSREVAAQKTKREAYDQVYQTNLKEVLDKQKEVKATARTTATTGRTNLTPAGIAERDRERERERREREEKEKEKDREQDQDQDEKDKDSMDVDEPTEGTKGKNRKWLGSTSSSVMSEDRDISKAASSTFLQTQNLSPYDQQAQIFGSIETFIQPLKDEAGEEYLERLTDVAEVLGIDDPSFSSFASAISRLSAEEIAVKRSELRLHAAEDELMMHLASMKHEEALVSQWLDTMEAEPPPGSSIAALEKRKAALSSKAREYQEELRATMAQMPEDPPLTFTQLAAYHKELRQKEKVLAQKRARVKAFQGLPPNLELARHELQHAQNEQMKLVQLRERLLDKMASGVS